MNARQPILSELGQAAVGYARRGWPVFPIMAGHKGEDVPDASHPKGQRSTHHLRHGHLDASADVGQVAEWWRRWPDANIGLHLAAAGLVAVDADTYKPDCRWDAFIADHEMPATLVQRSARGGSHFIFRAPSGVTFPGVLRTGVEIKHRGYVLLEPSRFEGGTYRWQTDHEPAPVPDWLHQRDAAREGRRSPGGPGAASAADRERVLRRLRDRPNDLARPDWLRLCLALKHALGEDGRAAWLDFCARYQGEQKPGEAERVWDTSRPDGSVGIGTVLHLLREPGGPSAAEPVDQMSAERTNDRPPADADAFDLSHDALACELGARSWDADARYVAGWGQWLFWDGTRWARDTSLQHMTRARAFLVRRAEELTAWAERKAEGAAEREADKLTAWARAEARTLRSATTVAAVTGLARSNAASAAGPDDFDADPWLLGTPGGTVDLRTGETRPARRGDGITRLAAVGPATGRPERWLAFLDEVMGGDRELVAFLQRAAGYSLTGDTSEHRLLFPYGGGANGKSTFLETLFRVWGDYATRIPAVSLLNSQVERHPTDIAGLRGARMVMGSELPKGKTWDESAIKDLTGGDTIKARLMRQDFFDFRPQFTLWIAGNTLPSFKGVDEALRRRVVLVPFAVTIPAERRDLDLPRKLDAEAGQILAWAVEGALEWQRRGLAVPGSVADASREYLDGEDTLGQFLADETVEEPAAFVATADLYQRFRQWMDGQGLASPWSVNTFSKELRGRGFTDHRTTTARGFRGLRLAQ